MLSLSSPIATLTSASTAAAAPPVHRRRFRFPLASAATFEGSKPSHLPYLQLQHRMATCTSLYEVLGIAMGASSQDIKAAYRRMARISHPDVAAIDRKDSSADEFMRIHAAYSTLSDPAKRAVYDGKLYTKKRPFTVGGLGYRGRNWETDQCW